MGFFIASPLLDKTASLLAPCTGSSFLSCFHLSSAGGTSRSEALASIVLDSSVASVLFDSLSDPRLACLVFRALFVCLLYLLSLVDIS